MNVLVAYFSQTGNTEKIAKAIWEEASQGHNAELKRIEEVVEGDLQAYDFVFVGSPLHAGGLAGPVKAFLKGLRAKEGQKMAGFITHFAPAYPEQDMARFTEPMTAACDREGIKFMGCFDCQGALVESLHEVVKKGQNFSDAQWEELLKKMAGRPNEEDAAEAKAFSRRVLS